MTTYSSILQKAMELTPQQRIEMAHTLWDSLADDEAAAELPLLSESWKNEIARRSADFDAGTAKT